MRIVSRTSGNSRQCSLKVCQRAMRRCSKLMVCGGCLWRSPILTRPTSCISTTVRQPLGPWKPHKRNPVKSDVRNSRPAGRLFYWNGDLYRPAQDSSQRYGYAMSINRVLRLTPDEFVRGGSLESAAAMAQGSAWNTHPEHLRRPHRDRLFVHRKRRNSTKSTTRLLRKLLCFLCLLWLHFDRNHRS